MVVFRVFKSGLLFVLALASASVQAGVFVTADVYSTPGLDGYTTYDLSLTTSEGAFLSFVFDPEVGSGISGPLYQSPGFMGTASAVLDGGLDAGNLADSRFLLSPSAKTLNFNNSESDSHLATVFGTFAPDLDYSITTTPFARLVTNTPDLVHVLGSVGISPSRGAAAQLFGVDFRLSDLAEWNSPMPADVPEAKAIAAAEAEWQAQVAEQTRLREEARRIYEEQQAAEQARLEELARLAAELSQTPSEEISPGGEAGIALPLDPPSNGEEGLIITIEHPELGVVRPTPGWVGGEHLTIDLTGVGEVDFQIDFNPIRVIDVGALLDHSLVLRTWADSYQPTIAYDSGALAFSTFSLAADNIGTSATPEPGAGVLVLVAITVAAGSARRK